MTVWTQDGETLASDRRTVVHTAPGVDRDSDGVADSSDNPYDASSCAGRKKGGGLP
jgi:hypothetical protein